MKGIYEHWIWIKKSLSKIKLIDRCLIIFMIILMSQSIYNLFINEANSNSTTSIDILIRTTAASIFGYFLSANFIKKSINKHEKSNMIDSDLIKETSLKVSESLKSVEEKNSDASENAIDSLTNDYKGNIENKNYSSDAQENNIEDDNETTEQQVIIVTVIGVVALIVIILVRNLGITSSASLASVSQLRDFVSGSVGFLLGCPTKTNK